MVLILNRRVLIYTVYRGHEKQLILFDGFRNLTRLNGEDFWIEFCAVSWGVDTKLVRIIAYTRANKRPYKSVLYEN
jgi:hypothetical protein